MHSMSLYFIILLNNNRCMLAMYENDICTNEIDLSGWEFTLHTIFTKTKMYVIMDIGVGQEGLKPPQLQRGLTLNSDYMYLTITLCTMIKEHKVVNGLILACQ